MKEKETVVEQLIISNDISDSGTFFCVSFKLTKTCAKIQFKLHRTVSLWLQQIIFLEKVKLVCHI